MAKEKRIDEYIKNAQPFAQPILKHLRTLIHKSNPLVTETIKWGMPSFEYKGPYCGFASFKSHCSFMFWKTSLLSDPNKILKARSSAGGEAMGNLGRITSLKDLPPDKVLIDFLKQAKKLNDEGIKVVKQKPVSNKSLIVPKEFLQALEKNKKANLFFTGLSPSQKREYTEWIDGAKSIATKTKRLDTTIEWLSQNKIRNWKYVKKKI